MKVRDLDDEWEEEQYEQDTRTAGMVDRCCEKIKQQWSDVYSQIIGDAHYYLEEGGMDCEELREELEEYSQGRRSVEEMGAVAYDKEYGYDKELNGLLREAAQRCLADWEVCESERLGPGNEDWDQPVDQQREPEGGGMMHASEDALSVGWDAVMKDDIPTGDDFRLVDPGPSKCEKCGKVSYDVQECWGCDANICIDCDPDEMRSDFDDHTYCTDCGPYHHGRKGEKRPLYANPDDYEIDPDDTGYRIVVDGNTVMRFPSHEEERAFETWRQMAASSIGLENEGKVASDIQLYEHGSEIGSSLDLTFFPDMVDDTTQSAGLVEGFTDDWRDKLTSLDPFNFVWDFCILKGDFYFNPTDKPAGRLGGAEEGSHLAPSISQDIDVGYQKPTFLQNITGKTRRMWDKANTADPETGAYPKTSVPEFDPSKPFKDTNPRRVRGKFRDTSELARMGEPYTEEEREERGEGLEWDPSANEGQGNFRRGASQPSLRPKTVTTASAQVSPTDKEGFRVGSVDREGTMWDSKPARDTPHVRFNEPTELSEFVGTNLSAQTQWDADRIGEEEVKELGERGGGRAWGDKTEDQMIADIASTDLHEETHSATDEDIEAAVTAEEDPLPQENKVSAKEIAAFSGQYFGDPEKVQRGLSGHPSVKWDAKPPKPITRETRSWFRRGIG